MCYLCAATEGWKSSQGTLEGPRSSVPMMVGPQTFLGVRTATLNALTDIQ